jgi:hypothetical protein
MSFFVMEYPLSHTEKNWVLIYVSLRVQKITVLVVAMAYGQTFLWMESHVIIH